MPSPLPALLLLLLPATSPAAAADSLDAFVKAQQTKVYRGKRITIQAKDIELAQIFLLISEASEFNIVLSDRVQGKALLNLNDVPWDQALDVILQSYRLVAERNGNVLRITTRAALAEDRAAEAAARRAQNRED